MLFLLLLPLLPLRAQDPHPATDSVAQVVAGLLRQGNWNGVYDRTDSFFRSKVPRAAFTGQMNQLQRTAFGNFHSIVYDRRQQAVHYYKAAFDEANLYLIIACNAQDSITTFALRKYFVPGQDSLVQRSNPMRSQLDRVVDSVVRNWLRTSYSAGMTIGVYTGGTATFYGYGETKAGNGRLPDENSLYEIGSISKTFTALLLAKRYNAGVLNPDSCISLYLPDSLPRLAWKEKPITLTHLSNHSSGIPSLPLNFKVVPGYNNGDPYRSYSREMLLHYLKSFTPYREPGKNFEYSNMGVAILGQVLELQSGKRYHDLVNREICRPLGLRHTGQFPARLRRVNRTSGYTGTGDATPPWTFQAFAAAGALHSTAADLLRYARFVLQPGQGPLADALERTLVPALRTGPATQTGLGWFLQTTQQKTFITHSGGTGGYRSTLLICRGTGDAVVVLSNTAIEVDALAFSIMEYLTNRK